MTRLFIPRRALQPVEDALSDTRVVAVIGARQVGKSTLVHRLVQARSGVLEANLDRSSDRDAARADPEGFVRHDGLMVIDEIQRVPDLSLAIKHRVDTDPRPGSFLLTGSSRLLGLRPLPDSLIGRMETIELWPLSQGEIDRHEEHFVDLVLDGPEPRLRTNQTPRSAYLERLVRGGFPEAVGRAPTRRSRFFESYITDLIDRDVVRISEIQHRDGLRKLLTLLAGRAAQPIVVDTIASELQLPSPTVQRYLALFEEVFLIKQIPAWSDRAASRALQRRKLIFTDSGIAAHALSRTAKRLERNDSMVGPLMENFVIGEISRQLTWSEVGTSLHHFRTRDGQEVDAVLASRDGRIVGIEVKAGESVRSEDFRHLRYLQRRVGERMQLGIVLYAGDAVRSFGDRMIAAPIDSLWAS